MNVSLLSSSVWTFCTLLLHKSQIFYNNYTSWRDIQYHYDLVFYTEPEQKKKDSSPFSSPWFLGYCPWTGYLAEILGKVILSSCTFAPMVGWSSGSRMHVLNTSAVWSIVKQRYARLYTDMLIELILRCLGLWDLWDCTIHQIAYSISQMWFCLRLFEAQPQNTVNKITSE